MIDLTKGIELTDKPNFVAQPIADAIYAELMTGSSADMMLESVTIDDVDHAYLGDEMLYVSIATGTAMFEAVTSERLRLSQTMRAFVRSLNRGMNGTGIKAGTDDAGIDEEGRKTVGGAIIGKVRRVNNIPIMTALIPLSDGQSISLIFHSPTADNGRIKNSDLLVAFRFLLNKRDVTHIVAPIGGRDVSLQQVSQALANLAERNSAKFTKQQSAQVKLRADIEGLNAEADQLSEQQSTLLEQVETHQQSLMNRQSDTQQLRGKLATQRQINADLEAQLAALKTNAGSDVITLPGETGRTFSDTTRKLKEGLSMSGSVTLSNGAEVAYKTADENGDLVGWVQITDPSGQIYKMPSPSSQGAKMGETATKLLKAYRENKADKFAVAAPVEPTPGSDDTQQGADADLQQLVAVIGNGLTDAAAADWAANKKATPDFIRFLIRQYGTADDKAKQRFVEGIEKSWKIKLPGTGSDNRLVAKLARDYVDSMKRPTGTDFLNTYFMGEAPKASQNPVYVPHVEGGDFFAAPINTAIDRYREALPNPKLNSTLKEQANFLIRLVKAEKDFEGLAESVEDGFARLADGSILTLEDGKLLLSTTDDETHNAKYSVDVGDRALAEAIEDLVSSYRLGNVEYMTPESRAKNNPEPPKPDSQPSPGNYRYALVNRPAGPATIPEGNTAILPPVEQSEPYGRIARHGFVTYDAPLSDADMAAFELKLIPTHADLDALATTIAQGRMNSYAAEYLEMATDDADTFRSQVSIFARKDAPNVAFPQGDDLAYFLQAMKGALAEAAKNPPEKDAGTGEGGGEEVVKKEEAIPGTEGTGAEEVSEADKAANDALAYLQSILSLQSKDMGVIREARTKVRGAIGALQAAGRDVENEPLVNDAAQHLSDLLVAIQREGAPA